MAGNTLEPEIQKIIDRWKLTLEPMDDSRYAVYAAVGHSDRVLVLVWSDVARLNAANDFIEMYLKESDPTLAAALLEDIDRLAESLDDLGIYRFHKS